MEVVSAGVLSMDGLACYCWCTVKPFFFFFLFFFTARRALAELEVRV